MPPCSSSFAARSAGAAPRGRGGAASAAAAGGRSGGRADGIPLMLHEELPGAREKLREAEGWLEKAQCGGLVRARRQGRRRPSVRESRARLERPELARERPLVRGAPRPLHRRRARTARSRGRRGEGMGSRFWLERDCEFVATDILVDENIGLGRGAFYGDFGRVQADGENLPFADATFDVTYCVATLHHALDLSKMVREMARVTRAGRHRRRPERGHPRDRPERGQSGPGRREGARDQRARPHGVGVSRRVHACGARRAQDRALRRLAAGPLRLLPLAACPKVGMTLGTLAHLSAARYAGVSIYARKRSTMSTLSTYLDVVRYRELLGESLPPRPAGEVPRLGARRPLDGRQSTHAHGRLPTRLRRRLEARRSRAATTIALFLLSGLAVWTFFAAALQSSTRSMLDNANLIRKTRFPRQLVPLSVVVRRISSASPSMLVLLLVVNFIALPRVRATELARDPARRRSSSASSAGSRSRSRRSTCSSATSSSSSPLCSCRSSS